MKKQKEKKELYSYVIDLLNAHGEKALDFGFLSAETGIPLKEWYHQFPTLSALITFLQNHWQQHFLDQVHTIINDINDPSLSGREVLHELLLMRLECSQPNKKALEAIWRYNLQNITHSCPTLSAYFTNMDWILVTANLDKSGPYGALRQKMLGLCYGDILKKWFNDDTPDLTKTAAHIDKRLAQAEKIFPLIWQRG